MIKDRIKELREKNGLTISAFAKSLGISPTSASLYESGKQNPGKKTIAKICEVYGVEERYLLSTPGDKATPTDKTTTADKATSTAKEADKAVEEKKRGRRPKKTDVVNAEEEPNITAILARVAEVGVRKAAAEAGVAWQTVNKWKKDAAATQTPPISSIQEEEKAEHKDEKKNDVVDAEKKKTKIIIQSPLGGNITPRQILKKIPAGSDSVYIRVDENKLYWVKGDENGAVDIWG